MTLFTRQEYTMLALLLELPRRAFQNVVDYSTGIVVSFVAYCATWSQYKKTVLPKPPSQFWVTDLVCLVLTLLQLLPRNKHFSRKPIEIIYKTILKPIVIYGFETWVMSNIQENRLNG